MASEAGAPELAAAQGDSSTPDQPAPIANSPKNRIASLDFIRGLAVMGILAANIVAFGQPFSAYMFPEAFKTPHGETSNWMWVAQFVLIDGKMRGLFTLLFGAGMMLFMERAWARGSTRWLQAWRLLWLMLFGLLHFFFIWRGDILFLYGVAGMVALLCVRWTAKTQLTVGLIGFVLGSLAYLGMFGITYFVADTPMGEQTEFAEMREGLAEGKAEALADDAAEIAIHESGGYGDFVAHNLSEHAGDPLFSLLLFSFETLPLMLIGMALYRMGLFSGGFTAHKQRMWGWIGVFAGVLLTVPLAIWMKDEGLTYWGTLATFTAFGALPRLPMILGLVALLALWGSNANGWFAERVSAAGRAAFTNYLGTSVVMMLVFHGWAGGLYGELNRPQLYIVVVLAWVLMLAWSKPWLEKFRFGPLEWLWRCLTYRTVFPLRR